ncbi:MAG: metallophosphoesterase [Butyrivibrio sp.]|nr:metallophosphoesterase [Acetatifactor muris]MCM1560651.1 metallophosphoesterase [Butyrivibrio sp.]
MALSIVVFSDIHGNYAAFEQCLHYIMSRPVHTFIFLGDYLGEFPYPQKTMEMLYALKEQYTCFFIRGNKEDYWINRRNDVDCLWKDGNQTVGAMQYCYENLTERDIDFFQSLSAARKICFENSSAILACHGSPERNNEKMLPGNDRTRQIMEECACKYILCGHTHLQGIIEHDGRTVFNPGSVGVSLNSGGKAQFMVLHQEGQEWTPEFISIEYDKEKVIREMQESGLEKAAPCWMRITKHLILTGEVSHGAVLARAMTLCRQEQGNCDWYNIPDRYWEMALGEIQEIQ